MKGKDKEALQVRKNDTLLGVRRKLEPVLAQQLAWAKRTDLWEITVTAPRSSTW